MEQQLSLDWSGAANDQGAAVVYFLEAPATGLVKIGFTTKLDERLYDLQKGGGAAVSMRLLKAIQGDQRVESAMHRRFKAHRVRGEWFTLAPIRADIEAITAADAARLSTCVDCGKIIKPRCRRCRACCFVHRGVTAAARRANTAAAPKKSHHKVYAPGEEPPRLRCQSCGHKLGAQHHQHGTGLCRRCGMLSVWQTPGYREKMNALRKARGQVPWGRAPLNEP